MESFYERSKEFFPEMQPAQLALVPASISTAAATTAAAAAATTAPATAGTAAYCPETPAHDWSDSSEEHRVVLAEGTTWTGPECSLPDPPEGLTWHPYACQGSYILAAAPGHDCSHTIHPLPESDFNPQRQEAVENGGSSKPSVTSYSSAGLSESMDGRKRRREGWFDRDDRLMNGGEDKRNAKNRAAQKYGPNNAVCETRCKCGKCFFQSSRVGRDSG